MGTDDAALWPIDNKEPDVPDERDSEQTDRPSAETVKGGKTADPKRPTSTNKDEDESVRETIETDMEIEDRFEATDN